MLFSKEDSTTDITLSQEGISERSFNMKSVHCLRSLAIAYDFRPFGFLKLQEIIGNGNRVRIHTSKPNKKRPHCWSLIHSWWALRDSSCGHWPPSNRCGASAPCGLRWQRSRVAPAPPPFGFESIQVSQTRKGPIAGALFIPGGPSGIRTQNPGIMSPLR